VSSNQLQNRGSSQTNLADRAPTSVQPIRRSDIATLLGLAVATVIVHLLAGGRYGFHRDELATLEDARHLAWGYVAYPPMTPFFGRLSLLLFGTSLAGFRFFAAFVQAIAVVLTGLMAREMGGGRGAQLLAATATLPFCLGFGALMQYVSFDYFCWVLTAYLMVRLLESADQRWWIAIGSAIGLGMLAKYTMAFFAVATAGAVLITDARRYLKNKWLWYGLAASLAIFLPNFLWQVQHHFVSLDFLRYIHERDVQWGRAKNFLPGQLELTLLALPLAVAGLYFYLFREEGRRFRSLGWMYLFSLILFLVAKGRWYYLAPAYPMLFAGGSVWGEAWVATLPRKRASWAKGLVWTLLVADVLVSLAVALPLAQINSSWWRLAIKVNSDLREEIGWPELVETVADIRDSLPAEDRSRVGILAGNYGEAGAINLYGERYGLPPAISGVNSLWQRGYGDPPPETLIVLGISREFLDRNFASCRLVGHPSNRYGVENEETIEHPDIFLCRGLRQSWPEFWRDFQSYR
jgi:hypothetical protein